MYLSLSASTASPSAPAPAAARRRRPRAFTLLEIMLALTVTALIGSAICALIVASMNSDRFLRANNSAQSEIELAVDRISNNIHEAQTGSIIVGTATLSTLTQPDPANSYATGVLVSYALAADPSIPSQKNLVETDQRYGTNILIHNISTFTIAPVAGVPNLYQIDIVIGTAMAEERHFKVLARN